MARAGSRRRQCATSTAYCTAPSMTRPSPAAGVQSDRLCRSAQGQRKPKRRCRTTSCHAARERRRRSVACSPLPDPVDRHSPRRVAGVAMARHRFRRGRGADRPHGRRHEGWRAPGQGCEDRGRAPAVDLPASAVQVLRAHSSSKRSCLALGTGLVTRWAGIPRLERRPWRPRNFTKAVTACRAPPGSEASRRTPGVTIILLGY